MQPCAGSSSERPSSGNQENKPAFYCCQCWFGPMILVLFSSCIGCGHPVCPSCSRNGVPTRSRSSTLTQPRKVPIVRAHRRTTSTSSFIFDDDENDERLEHLLNPAVHVSKLFDLEQQLAQICGIANYQQWEAVTERRSYKLEVCKDELKRLDAGFRFLHERGFAGERFTILIEDRDYAAVARAVSISGATLAELSRLVETLGASYMLGDGSSADLERGGLLENVERLIGHLNQTLQLSPDLGRESLRFDLPLQCREAKEQRLLEKILRGCSIIYPLLAISLVSYSGSHVCPFHHTLYHQHVKDFAVGGTEHITLHRRRLACLESFVGGPAWVLGSGKDDSRQYSVLLSVQDFADLWGPVWPVKASVGRHKIIQTERGFILPHKVEGDVTCCHWTDDIEQARQLTQAEHRPIDFSDSERLLVGTPRTARQMLSTSPIQSFLGPLRTNQSCDSELRTIDGGRTYPIQVLDAQYSPKSGSFQHRNSQEEWGHGSEGRIWKRMPARTLKSRLVEHIMRQSHGLRKILKLQVGLEISLCTGNARRISLWDTLKLGYLIQRHRSGNIDPTCSHEIGDFACFQDCWIGDPSMDLGLSSLTPNDESKIQKEVIQRCKQNVILPMLQKLAVTGVSSNGVLDALWPLLSPPQIVRLGYSREQANDWIAMLKDTYDVATFAVLTGRCFAYSGRDDLRGSNISILHGQMWATAVLQTAIHLEPPMALGQPEIPTLSPKDSEGEEGDIVFNPDTRTGAPRKITLARVGTLEVLNGDPCPLTKFIPLPLSDRGAGLYTLGALEKGHELISDEQGADMILPVVVL